MVRKISICLWLLVILIHSASAQGRFMPFTSAGFPQTASTAHFDVHHKEGQSAAASRVAKYAEMALGELGFMYDYKPHSRYHLIYSDCASDFSHSNYDFPSSENKEAGEVPLPRLDAPILLPHLPSQLYAEVKTKVSRLVLREFEYGQDLPKIIQNELLTYQPKWFYEGLTDFTAKGWTYEDESWLLQEENAEKWVEKSIEGSDYSSMILRKSIWFYIAKEYGPQKFAELVYLAKISHSSETAIITVLGIDLHTLTQRWREYMLKHTERIRSNRMTWNKIPSVREISLPTGFTLISYAYHPPTHKIVAYLNKKGKHSVWILDTETLRWSPTPLQSGYTHPETPSTPLHYPMDWMPNGEGFTTTLPQKQGEAVIHYNILTSEITYLDIAHSWGKLQAIAYSHDGKKLALSCFKDGQSDLMIGNADGTEMRQITHDIFDDMHPTWSYDDATLYFSSNRSHHSLSPTSPVWYFFRNNTDIFAYKVGAKQDSVSNITQTPLINELSPTNPNSYELYFLTDERGMWDVYKLNLFQREKSPAFAIETGINTCDLGESEAVFSTIYQGKPRLLQAPVPILAVIEPAYTAYRKSYLELWETKTNPPTIKPTENHPVKDSADTYSRIRYYIFDDNQPDNNVVYSGDIEAKGAEDTPIPYIPNWNKLEVERKEKAAQDWRAKNMVLQYVYHPLARAGFKFGTHFHDLMQHHAIEASVTPYFSMLPFVQFGNADANIQYTYKKHRADIWAEVNGWRRNYQIEGLAASLPDTISHRFSSLEYKAGIAYPISVYTQLGTIQSLVFLDKKDLRFGQGVPLEDRKASFWKSSLFAEYENIRYLEDFPRKGTRVRGEFHLFQALKSTTPSFQVIRVSAQHYQPIWKHIVFAMNLNSAFSFGKQGQSFYLGGIDNWALGVLHRNRPSSISYTGRLHPDITSFGFQEFIMPMRGFWYNTRNGNKFVVWNGECRIPITRMLKHKLNDKLLYNWEIIPFVDAGTIWRRGNPLSQKQPIDLQVIPASPVIVELQTFKSPFLYCFGLGAKTTLLNYQLRADMAWGVEDNTLQRPRFMLGIGRSF